MQAKGYHRVVSSVDKKLSMCRGQRIVPKMGSIQPQNRIEQVQSRIKAIRISKKLSLKQAAQLSKGRITAIALGSYERGDRSVSVNKLILIAEIYGVPVVELFEPSHIYMPEFQLSVDVRKLLTTINPTALKITEVIRNIARMRGDWNGEVISLRAADIKHFQVFSGLTKEDISNLMSEYGFTRSK
jgi:transcriptional regulator with XRE-family HTH domain